MFTRVWRHRNKVFDDHTPEPRKPGRHKTRAAT